MGNRAVIAFGNPEEEKTIGIYLHWNGGRESVEAFLEAAKVLGVRIGDDTYAMSRVVQLIGNYLGGTTSLGLGRCSQLDCDNGDNGTYIVDPDTLQITGTKFKAATEANEERKKAILADVIQVNKSIFSR